jgi:hypothetical protein
MRKNEQKFSKTFSIEFEQWNGKLSQTIKLFFYQSQFLPIKIKLPFRSIKLLVSVLKRKQVQKHVVNDKNSFCDYGQVHQKYISTVKTFKIAKSGTG